MKRLRIFFVGLLSLLASCRTSGLSETSNIVGPDDRKVSFDEALQKTLGTISQNEEIVCTAFISAVGEITTASHCVDDNLASFTFKTFDKGQSSPITGIVVRYANADVLKLKANVTAPVLSTATFDPAVTTKLAALDRQSLKLVETETGTTELDHGRIYHTLDTIPGASGGALLQNEAIVGIHIGSISDRTNVAVSLSSIREADESSLSVQPERCQWNGRGCLPSGTKAVTVCGYNLTVPTAAYIVCSGSLAALPVGCSIGAPITAGTSCGAAGLLATTSCGISAATAAKMVKCCVQGGC
jgi:hypothetical protein